MYNHSSFNLGTQIMTTIEVKSAFHATSSEVDANKNIMKVKIMAQINDAIKARYKTQNTAAKKLGIAQSRISELANYKINLFTIDNLLDLSDKLDATLQTEQVNGVLQVSFAI